MGSLYTGFQNKKNVFYRLTEQIRVKVNRLLNPSVLSCQGHEMFEKSSISSKRQGGRVCVGQEVCVCTGGAATTHLSPISD